MGPCGPPCGLYHSLIRYPQKVCDNCLRLCSLYSEAEALGAQGPSQIQLSLNCPERIGALIADS